MRWIQVTCTDGPGLQEFCVYFMTSFIMLLLVGDLGTLRGCSLFRSPAAQASSTPCLEGLFSAAVRATDRGPPGGPRCHLPRGAGRGRQSVRHRREPQMCG